MSLVVRHLEEVQDAAIGKRHPGFEYLLVAYATPALSMLLLQMLLSAAGTGYRVQRRCN